MVSRDILRKILERCRDVASEIKDEYALHDVDVDLKLYGDAYWMMFKVDGGSGTVTYKTPLFKVYDELEEYLPKEYEEYCYKILKDMAKLANEEY